MRVISGVEMLNRSSVIGTVTYIVTMGTILKALWWKQDSNTPLYLCKANNFILTYVCNGIAQHIH